LAIWCDLLTDPNAQSTQLDQPISSLDCSESFIATASKDTIQLWDYEANEHVHSIKCATDVKTVKWSLDGREIVSTHSEPRNEIKLWQVDSVQKDKDKIYWFTKMKELDECH